MKSSATTAIGAVAIAATGFLSGRFYASRQPDEPVRAPLNAISTPANQARTERNEVKDSPEQQAAMSEALLAMLDTGGYEQTAKLYSAAQRLDLAHIRELHARVVQMPANAALLELVTDRWVELDPGFAVDYVRRLPEGANLVDNWGILAAWARRFPEAAIAEGLKSPTASKGRDLLKNAFLGLAATDPLAAVSRLNVVNDRKLQGEILEWALWSWGRNDPSAAARWVQGHPESYSVGSDGNQVIAAFAGRLASADPVLAREFAQSLPKNVRDTALLHVANEWVYQEPEKALAWARENGIPLDSRAISNKLSTIAAAMVRAPEKTVAWLETLPPGERLEVAYETLTYAKAAIAPRVFALVPEEEQPRFVEPFLKSLNKRKAGDAKAWAMKLPEGPLRVAAFSKMISSFSYSDPVGMIDKFPAGLSRDAAYAAHVEKTVSKGEPDVKQLEKIADDAVRREAAVGTYYRWRQKGRAEADKWLESTPYVPAEMKARLLKQRED